MSSHSSSALPSHDPAALARVDTFLFAAAGTVLIVRAALAATGYPKVGGGSFHIAHVVWGGILLGVGLVTMAVALGTATRFWACLIGGVGFGLFIDEVGKFVTADVNYFYSPASAIIYTVLLASYLLGREAVVRRRLSPVRVRAIAGLAFADHQLGQLSEGRRVLVIRMLQETVSPEDAETLSRMLSETRTDGQRRRTWTAEERVGWAHEQVRSIVAAGTKHRNVRQTMFVLMSIQAAASLLSIAAIVAGAISGSDELAVDLTGFDSDLAWLIGATAQALLISFGILLFARHHVITGLRMMHTGLFVAVTYTSLWQFDHNPALGLVTFGIVSILLTMTGTMLSDARSRHATPAG